MDANEARAGEGPAPNDDPLSDEPRLASERRISGYAPRRAARDELEVCPNDDAEREPLAAGNEPTRVAPDELIEALREASRVDDTAGQPVRTETPLVSTTLPEVRPAAVDEDDTLIFVLHETGAPSPAWMRLALPLVSAAALLLGLTLLTRPEPRRQVARGFEPSQIALPASKSKVSAPVPQVQQLEPSGSEGSQPGSDGLLALEGRAEPAQQDAGADRDLQRKWMRAMHRAEERLAAEAYESAVISFKRAVSYNPDDPRAYAGLGEAYLRLGKRAESVRVLRKAVQLAPSDESLRLSLERAFAAQAEEPAPEQSPLAAESAPLVETP